MVVTINPFTCSTTPEDPAGIAARLNQITFNAALLQEMRCLSAGSDAPRLHLIGADEHLQDLGLYSKLMTDWSFLNWLRAQPAPMGGVPVVVFTAAYEVQVTGANAVYSKPYSLDSVLEAVDRHAPRPAIQSRG